ncbi:MAG: iron-sulfur cluster assembly accessory protein [Candidatus Binataceae bacterium]|nr:iron-sulfur cluster assembly accessory protein [Candidatus Binataceae bacterium]
MSEQIESVEQNTKTESATLAISLTPKALETVRKMHVKEGLGPEQGLRIGVVGGGCSGFQYTLNFDLQKEGDTVTEIDGIKVLVDELSFPYMAGTTLDFVEGLHNAGFRFNNPRAGRVCGCGSSFSA